MASLYALILSFLVSPFGGASLDTSRCELPAKNEPYVRMNDYSGLYDLERMAQQFEEEYESGRRLKGRAYYDHELKSYVMVHPNNKQLVRINEKFIRSVARHIEIALERRYADFVFFPDMGHAHLHIPEADYEHLTKVEPINIRYEGFFAYRGLKMLYHTAEKLVVREGDNMNGGYPQDPILLWRYFTRNPVGDNNGGENVFPLFHFQDPQKYNTVKDVPGHKEYSAGYNISASKDGCFPYKKDGKVYYFDISLESLPCDGCY